MAEPEKEKRGVFVPRDWLVPVLSAIAAVLCYAGYCELGGIVDKIADRVEQRIKDRVPPVVPVPLQPKPATPPVSISPKDAAVRIRSGSAGCSGTILLIGDPAEYYVLTAGHCNNGVGSNVTVYYLSQQIVGKVIKSNKSWDVSLVKLNHNSFDLPIAIIAKELPERRVSVWHKGYGVHIPGNIVDGQIIDPGSLKSNCTFTTRLSSGDSGSGQFRQDTGELIAIGNWGSGGIYGGTSLNRIRNFILDAPISDCPTCPKLEVCSGEETNPQQFDNRGSDCQGCRSVGIGDSIHGRNDCD